MNKLLLLAFTPFAVGSALAGLGDNFDTTQGTFVQEGGAPGPSIVSIGGANGNVLHLLNDGSNGLVNRYIYNRTDVGAFDTVAGSFDFRIASVDQGADGFHFAVLPTSVFGTTGGLAASLGIGAQEEPNINAAFAMGFDVYDSAANDISAHWNGTEVINTRPSNAQINLDNGLFHNISFVLQRVGNSTNATIIATPNGGSPITLVNHVMPLMQPYENRVEFSGRTGGADMTTELDNVNVAYSNPYTAPASVGSAGLIQDFDRLGTTNFTAVQQNQTNGGNYIPGPRAMPAETGSNGAFIRISQDTSGGNNNYIALHRAGDGGVAPVNSLQFDFRSTSVDQPADGFGFIMLPTSSTGRSGNGVASSEAEEPNYGGTFGIGFDTYPNGGESGNQVTLHWNGATVATNDISPGTLNLNNGVFNQAKLDVVQVAGGSNVTLSVIPDINGSPGAPVAVFTNQFIAGFTPYDYRTEFISRTGGADASVDIDQITTSALNLSGAPTPTTQTFEDASGTYYKGQVIGAGLAPALVSGGPTGSFLRVMHDGQNSQANTLTFNQAPSGTGVVTTDTISGEFDFRMGGPDGSADGFSLLLLPTSTYGSTGPVSSGANERVNLPGVFAFGFDAYDSDGGGPAESDNNFSVHFGSELANLQIDPNLVNIDGNLWNHAKIELDPDGLGNTLASLTITPDYYGVPGAPVNIFSNFLITGMVPYDFRVQFGARSGGLDANLDLDNISFIPEPMAPGLGLLGLALLARRRRSGSSG